MSLRSHLGMDGFDLALQAAVTAVVLFWIGATTSPPETRIGISVATTASLVVLGIRRHFGLRKLGRSGLTTGEMAAERIADLEQRIGDLEAGQGRMVELEERLDFAERLLAQTAADRRALVPGPEPVATGGTQ